MHNSYSKIKYYKTAVDNNEYSEYLVYKKDSMFVTECISWKIKDSTRSGGGRDYYGEFKDEEDAISKHDELLTVWGS